MARTDHGNGKDPVRLQEQLSRQDVIPQSVLTPDEIIARKEMDEGVRWAIREKFTQQQVGTPAAIRASRHWLLVPPALSVFVYF